MVIRVEAPSGGYNVTVSNGIGDIVPLLCADGAKRIAVITDDNVRSLYYDTLETKLTSAGYAVYCCTLPHGEATKNGNTYLNILEFLAERAFSRNDVLIALGGGVVGDVAGFAAATYMRGIRFVQIPTTLLSMTDSSVGGKTGIDLHSGKNLAGAFWQPVSVIIDTRTLKSLPQAEIKNGLGELIKYAVIEGGDILELLEDGWEKHTERIVAEAVDIKRKIVEADEKEGGLRRILNLGHTPAHAAEKLSGYSMPHGYAVAAGVNIVMRACAVSCGCPKADVVRIRRLCEKYGLPVDLPYTPEEMGAEAFHDKKADGDFVNLVAVRRIGKVESVRLPIGELAGFYAGKGGKL